MGVVEGPVRQAPFSQGKRQASNVLASCVSLWWFQRFLEEQ